MVVVALLGLITESQKRLCQKGSITRDHLVHPSTSPAIQAGSARGGWSRIVSCPVLNSSK